MDGPPNPPADFSYLKVVDKLVDWGWNYLSTVMDDYSRISLLGGCIRL